jgi:hypothetical protein
LRSGGADGGGGGSGGADGGGHAGAGGSEQHAQHFRNLIVQQLKWQNQAQQEHGKRGSPSLSSSQNKRQKTQKPFPNSGSGRMMSNNNGGDGNMSTNDASASSSLRHIMQGQQRMMRRNDMSLLGSKPRDRRIKKQGLDAMGGSSNAKKKKKTRRRQSAEDFAATFFS